MSVKEESGVISPPKFGTIQFIIEGTAPLVVERFSKKAELMAKMAEGSSAKNKKEEEAALAQAQAQAAAEAAQQEVVVTEPEPERWTRILGRAA